MLQSISWAHFIFVFSTVIFGYYTIVFLLLFRNEIVSFFKRDSKNSFHPHHPDQITPVRSDELMGSPKSESSRDYRLNQRSLESNELVVSHSASDEHSIDGGAIDTISVADDQKLFEEVTALIDAVLTLSKDEVSILFSALLQRYSHLTDSAFRDRISLLIQDGCLGHGLRLDLSEIKSWWRSVN